MNLRHIRESTNFYPIVVSYCFYKSGQLNFYIPGKIVQLKNVNVSLIRSLLKLSTGYLTCSQILKEMKNSNFKISEIRKTMEILIENHIVINSHEYYDLYHMVGENPLIYWKKNTNMDLNKMLKGKSYLFPIYKKKKTYLEKLLAKRESKRKFLSKPISKAKILRLLWATYGKTNRSRLFKKSNIGVGTVPSAGGLYPLRLFIISIQDSPSLKSGVHECTNDGLIFLKKIDISLLKEIFIGFYSDLSKASLIIVIVGNFKQSSQKYFNRGYRYVFLEAGHAAQNAYLWCAEQNLGITEVGSFDDKQLSSLIRINYPKEAPLTTLVVGKL